VTDDAHAPASPAQPDPPALRTVPDGGTSAAEGTPPDRPGWVRDTVVFLSGQTVSLFGSMLVQYAVMWHLTLETKSGGVMALYAVFGFLPQAVISIFGGVWADRLDRKKLIIGADATIAVVTLALAMFMAAGATDLWLIFVAIAIRSAGAGIQMPAVAALLPQIVPADKLMRVNGITGTIQSAMMLVAPAAAAAVYASMSIVAVFYIDVVTAVIGIGLLLLVTVPRLVRSEESKDLGYFDDLVGGVKYIATHAFVRWILVLYAVVFVLIVAPSFLTPLMIVRTFGEEVWKLTVNELAFSIGMVLGGAAVAAWATTWNRVKMILVSTLVFGPLADVVPVQWVLIGAGILTFIVVAIAALIPAGRRAIAIGAEPTPASPHAPDGEPETV
jgi:DHA3 family macrolide efflux protein-like MFS transporter